MKAVAIFTGSELLNGQTTNSNQTGLGRELASCGWTISRAEAVPDGLDAIQDALSRALHEDAELILICGGLGPTADDLTRSAVAQTLGRDLFTCGETLAEIRQRLSGRTHSEEHVVRQAEWIRGAVKIANVQGLAPGLLLRVGHSRIVLLPGPPREFLPMVRDGLIPLLKAEFPPLLRSAVLHTCGLRESDVELKTRPLLQEFPDLIPAWCASLGAVRVTLSLPAGREAELSAAVSYARKLFGPDALEHDSAAAECLELARRRKLRLATAESCTGGLIAAALTDVPGASEVFVGGFVCYANDWKQSLLQVPAEILATHGAVSEATALALAAGLCRFAECGVVSTGIAGPGGGTPEKPVGTVWIATLVEGRVRSRLLQLRGDRKDIRDQAVTHGLDSLRRHLLEIS